MIAGNHKALGFTMRGMKAHISITLLAAVAALGAGCASDGYLDSNRNRGAAAGAATGAVLGGVIGHNTDRVSTGTGAAVGAVAGGLAGAAIGQRADEREARQATDTTVAVQTIPPAPVSEPQETVPPQPAANAVWIRGHYAWTGSNYQWQSGRWEIPPPGATNWVQPSWQPAPQGGYVYVRGHWQ
jgi:hypothetical protein